MVVCIRRGVFVRMHVPTYTCVWTFKHTDRQIDIYMYRHIFIIVGVLFFCYIPDLRFQIE